MRRTNGTDDGSAAGAPASRPGNAGGRLERLGLVARLGLSRRETPALGKGGAYDIGSDAFRKVCAIMEDGTVYVVRAYNTAERAAEEAELRNRFRLPPEKERRAATLAEIAALHGEAAQALVSSRPTAGQKLLRRVLTAAAAMGASDVKLKEEGTHAIVRIRAGAGEHTHGAEWQAGEAREAVSWIHTSRDGGDGKASLIEGEPAGFSIGQAGRLSGMPDGIGALRGQIAWHGDVKRFMVLRLLPKVDAAAQADLAGLGLDDDILAALAEERRSEAGLVIVAGSTGDGKSTTMVRNLARLYEERGGGISICTIEDPIEYPIHGEGISQFAVKPGTTPEERRASMAEALMTFVRINPDVGMIAEIRSAWEVNEVLHFVSSGHKVYTSVHADSASGVLFRLVSLGVRPEELSAPGIVNLVMRQKLVPALCRHCAEPLTGPALARVEGWLGEDPLLAAAGLPAGIAPLRRNRAGCEECLASSARLSGAAAETAKAAWAGYSGRRATAEFIRVDDGYRKLLRDRDAIGARERWLAPEAEGGMGGIPLETRLRRLVASGTADFEQVTNEALPEPRPALPGPDATDDGEASR